MQIIPLAGTTHYFTSVDLPYPCPPSEACPAARNILNTLSGLSSEGRRILERMMIEIEEMIRAGVDSWLGFNAEWFSPSELLIIRNLVEKGFLLRTAALSEVDHDHKIVYFLSPGVVS